MRDPAPVAPPAARVPRGRACQPSRPRTAAVSRTWQQRICSAHLAASAAPAALGNVTLVARFGATAAAAGLADAARAPGETVLAKATAAVSARRSSMVRAARGALGAGELRARALGRRRRRARRRRDRRHRRAARRRRERVERDLAARARARLAAQTAAARRQPRETTASAASAHPRTAFLGAPSRPSLMHAPSAFLEESAPCSGSRSRTRTRPSSRREPPRDEMVNINEQLRRHELGGARRDERVTQLSTHTLHVECSHVRTACQTRTCSPEELNGSFRRFDLASRGP